MLRHLSHLDSNKNQAFKKMQLKSGMKEIEIFFFFSAVDVAENVINDPGEAVCLCLNHFP